MRNSAGAIVEYNFTVISNVLDVRNNLPTPIGRAHAQAGIPTIPAFKFVVVIVIKRGRILVMVRVVVVRAIIGLIGYIS